jgi:hypothetical protein
MSRCPSLLQTTVAKGGLCLSLLCYHCSDAVVAMGQLPVTTVTYGPLLQCMFIVVDGFQSNYSHEPGPEKEKQATLSTQHFKYPGRITMFNSECLVCQVCIMPISLKDLSFNFFVVIFQEQIKNSLSNEAINNVCIIIFFHCMQPCM